MTGLPVFGNNLREYKDWKISDCFVQKLALLAGVTRQEEVRAAQPRSPNSGAGAADS